MNIQEHFDTIEAQITLARQELDVNAFSLLKSTVEAELRTQFASYPETRQARLEGDKDWQHRIYKTIK